MNRILLIIVIMLSGCGQPRTKKMIIARPDCENALKRLQAETVELEHNLARIEENLQLMQHQ